MRRPQCQKPATAMLHILLLLCAVVLASGLVLTTSTLQADDGLVTDVPLAAEASAASGTSVTSPSSACRVDVVNTNPDASTTAHNNSRICSIAVAGFWHCGRRILRGTGDNRNNDNIQDPGSYV